jgi:imidazolonepropionase
MLPAIAAEKLADAVDGFLRGHRLHADEIVELFEAAKANGLPVRLHADQLSNLHGAALAAAMARCRLDHLEYADEASAIKMAAAGTVAVLLPGAYLFHSRDESRRSTFSESKA